MVWKHPEMQTFAVALVRGALARARAGQDQFTTDIVADTVRGDGPGIAGSVVTLLKHANVLAPVGHTSDGQWYPLRRKSTREGRKDAWNNVYRLTSLGMAAEFLSRNGLPQAEQQIELVMC